MTSEQPLESADLDLLRDLRRSLRSAVVFHVMVSAPFAFAAVAMGWVTYDLGSRDSRMPGLLLFCLVCAGFFALAVYFGVKNTRLFRYVGNVLRSPEGVLNSVTRGELGGISERNGVTHYEVGGEFLPAWIPIRAAESRVIKCLTIVDDATHEAVAIEIERAISGIGVTRVMDRLAATRGYRRSFVAITERSSVARPWSPGLAIAVCN